MRVLPQRARTQLRDIYGLWVLHEARTRALHGWRVPLTTHVENREVARARQVLGDLPWAEFAVIMPTYRRPKMLQRAVESVLAQDMTDFQIIVVDDGAGLPELPADPRVNTVSLKKNTGILGLVRNIGIRVSRSRYLAFLDDDNEWRSNHLSSGLELLESGVDVVYTQVCRSFPDGRVLDVLSTPFDRRVLADAAFIDANSMLLRRAAGVRFSRVPRKKRTFPKEDWEFIYRISRHVSVEHLPIPTVDYLVNPNSFYTAWPGSE